MTYEQSDKEVFVLIEKGEFYAIFDSFESAKNSFQESVKYRFAIEIPLMWKELCEGLWYLSQDHKIGEVKIVQCPIHKVSNG